MQQQTQNNQENSESKKLYPEGYFVGRWMAIGVAVFCVLGLPISIITGNPGMIGVGPAVGLAVGLAIGSGLEEKYKKRGLMRPLTQEEKKKKRLSLTISLILLVLLAAAGLVVFLLR